MRRPLLLLLASFPVLLVLAVLAPVMGPGGSAVEGQVNYAARAACTAPAVPVF
jgi:hypothetical protein